jgi:tetratricopeptide (TPR) repeat protein
MTRLPRLLARLMLPLMLCAGLASRADELSDVRRLHDAGQTTEALRQADQFLAAHPQDAPMRFLKGVMLADEQHPTAAIEVFEALTQDYPDLAEPYNNLAALYAARGEYSRAREALARALRANPDYATAHENLGDVYAALAAQSYARALELEPNNATLPSKLALARKLFGHGASSTAASPSAPASAAASGPCR